MFGSIALKYQPSGEAQLKESEVLKIGPSEDT